MRARHNLKGKQDPSHRSKRLKASEAVSGASDKENIHPQNPKSIAMHSKKSSRNMDSQSDFTGVAISKSSSELNAVVAEGQSSPDCKNVDDVDMNLAEKQLRIRTLNKSEDINSDETNDVQSDISSQQDSDYLLDGDDEMVKEEKKLHQQRAAEERRRIGQQGQQINTATAATALEELLRLSNVYANSMLENMSKLDPEQAMQEAEQLAKQLSGKKRKKSSSKTAAIASQEHPQSIIYRGTLKDYQLKGVRWLLTLYCNGMNGILADQMGLGKTIQTLVFLAYINALNIKGPYLVLGPLSTLPNWLAELEKWTPQLTPVLYHGTKPEREELFNSKVSKLKDNLVVVTSYEILMADIQSLRRINWTYLVVDEGHRLKNMHCKLLKCLGELRVSNKLLLSGTPLQNNLTELWTLLHFLQPEAFGSVESLQQSLELTDLRSDGWQKMLVDQERKSAIVSKLHSILRPYLLRRTKDDVEKELPGKQEVILYAQMTPEQRKIQKGILDKSLMAEIMNSGVPSYRRGITSLNNTLMQLRKTCNHPDLITSSYSGEILYPEWQELRQQAGKLKLLDRILQIMKEQGRKVLIFSQMTRMLDILDTYLAQQGIETFRLDGSVSMVERQAQIQEFKTSTSKNIFLLSTRAGGLGINLTAADTCIIYDSDWNPHQDMQAMDRCHRIGQTSPVMVMRLCTANSVETRILKRAQSKLALERVVIKKGLYGGDFKESKSSSLHVEELLDLLRSAVQLDTDTPADISDADLSRVLDRTHLKNKLEPPYPLRGQGWEVVIHTQLEKEGELHITTD